MAAVLAGDLKPAYIYEFYHRLPGDKAGALEGQSEWRPCTTDEVMRLE